MPRKLIQIEVEVFLALGCSECNWVFNPSGAVAGETIEEMKMNSIARPDKEFALHVCVKRRRTTDQKVE
jgi:hypothetical protein